MVVNFSPHKWYYIKQLLILIFITVQYLIIYFNLILKYFLSINGVAKTLTVICHILITFHLHDKYTIHYKQI